MEYEWLIPELKIRIKLLGCNAPWILLENKTSLHPKQSIIIIFITNTTVSNHQKNNDLLWTRLFIYIISFNPQNTLQSCYLLASFLKMRKWRFKEGKHFAYLCYYITHLWCSYSLTYSNGKPNPKGDASFYSTYLKGNLLASFTSNVFRITLLTAAQQNWMACTLHINIHVIPPLGCGSCSSLTLECPSTVLHIQDHRDLEVQMPLSTWSFL